MKPSKNKRKNRDKGFSSVNPHAAGIDIGSQFHVVAVPSDRDEEPVRSFDSFTGDLHRLADWLVACRIETVAMESTGIDWMPLFEILQARKIEAVLCNARDVKHVPGRKTDVNDAQWLQQRHPFGLLGVAFIRRRISRAYAPICANANACSITPVPTFNTCKRR